VFYLSEFMSWNQKDHAGDWLLFEENMGIHLSIDETALSQGELYTIVTNKAAKGKKGSLVALIKGTESKYVNTVLKQMLQWKRLCVAVFQRRS